ncbi:hypothetical protein BDZ94DRAFT_1265600 [Collybia nuda]|uniref:Uncharacterized protein n=1 Tax=Collybia nuda TaxID=64659 RepID=A0A9P6CCH9_9AGAR|nr:hypothetical protein BDZ94DRAFT_1265600 [Collybia nuda]
MKLLNQSHDGLFPSYWLHRQSCVKQSGPWPGNKQVSKSRHVKRKEGSGPVAMGFSKIRSRTHPVWSHQITFVRTSNTIGKSGEDARTETLGPSAPTQLQSRFQNCQQTPVEKVSRTAVAQADQKFYHLQHTHVSALHSHLHPVLIDYKVSAFMSHIKCSRGSKEQVTY